MNFELCTIVQKIGKMPFPSQTESLVNGNLQLKLNNKQSDQILDLGEEKKLKYPEKVHSAQSRKQPNSTDASGSQHKVKPRPHQWKARALTNTALYVNHKNTNNDK